jgi:hypothetical protein
VHVEFSFLTVPGLYAATLPGWMNGPPELSSTVVVGGVPRNVQFGTPDRGHPGLVFVGAFEAGASEVSLYDQVGTRTPDPMSASIPVVDAVTDFIDDSEFVAQRFVYWKLLTGSVSTHFYPAEEGEPTLRQLIECMVVSEPRPGFPALEFREPLTGGDIREPAERDSVTFHAPGEAYAPWSITFTYAGPLARHSEFREAGVVGVTRAAASGVTVFCDGPAARAHELRGVAGEIAGSLTSDADAG